MLARFILSLFIVAILMVMCAQPAHAAGGLPPRPCIGVVVRTIEGVEYVRRRDGTACTRPATVRPTATARRGR